MSGIKIESVKDGEFSIIQKQGDRIVQIGLTKEQASMIHFMLAKMSETKPLIAFPKENDLVLRRDVCGKCLGKIKDRNVVVDMQACETCEESYPIAEMQMAGDDGQWVCPSCVRAFVGSI